MNLGDNAMRMKHTQYTIDAKVWLYPGESGWYFVTIPYDISEDIKHLFGDKARGWGSIPVVITLGSSSWKTSLFPDKKEGAYILPLKKEIRLKEKIQIGDSLHFLLEVKVS